MKNLMIFSGIFASIFATSLNSYNYNELPQSNHIYPNRQGGYVWTEPGDPSAENYLDRIPRNHSVTPDGQGGYYYNY